MRVLRVITGLLGTISNQLNDHSQRLQVDSLSLLDLQQSVLLDTAHILRRVL